MSDPLQPHESQHARPIRWFNLRVYWEFVYLFISDLLNNKTSHSARHWDCSGVHRPLLLSCIFSSSPLVSAEVFMYSRSHGYLCHSAYPFLTFLTGECWGHPCLWRKEWQMGFSRLRALRPWPSWPHILQCQSQGSLLLHSRGYSSCSVMQGNVPRPKLRSPWALPPRFISLDFKLQGQTVEIFEWQPEEFKFNPTNYEIY